VEMKNALEGLDVMLVCIFLEKEKMKIGQFHSKHCIFPSDLWFCLNLFHH
jgi:hypothetical protein